jgi:HSP20 family molecular chaperone IbpA
LFSDMFLLLRYVLLREKGEVCLSDSWRQRRKRLQEWLNRLDRVDRTKGNLDDMLRRVLRSPDENAKARERCCGKLERVPILHPKDPDISDKRELLIDVFEDQDSIVVVTELIGIDKSNVDVHATQNKLVISVDSTDREHCKEIQLPARVDVGSSSSRMKNGVLEIRLKKLGEELVVR